MPNTRHTLPESVRRDAVTHLDGLLATAIDLSLQAKQAHWNLRGPGFIALHQLFDQVHEKAEDASDLLAERIAALGGTAHGTLAAVARGTALVAYPEDASGETVHVTALADALARAGTGLRTAIDALTALGDAASADVATEIVREVDQMLWFVEAHLEPR
jgi:starvation-inducible DNA-binding protein